MRLLITAYTDWDFNTRGSDGCPLSISHSQVGTDQCVVYHAGQEIVLFILILKFRQQEYHAYGENDCANCDGC